MIGLAKLRALLESVDVEKIASDFLAVTPPKRIDGASQYLKQLLPIYASGGEIFNVELVAAKDYLNHVFQDGFGALEEPLTFRDRSELGFGLSLYNVPSLIKKLTGKGPKKSSGHPGGWESPPLTIKALKDFLSAMLPVSIMLDALKKKAVKGRKPPTPEMAAKKAAVLANKDLRTCACCFREIAMLGNGLIADHGYTLPAIFRKTKSCYGKDFRPLEVSDDGLKFMVKLLTDTITQLDVAIESSPNWKILQLGHSKDPKDFIGKDDPRWDATFKAKLENITSYREQSKEQLKKFEKLVASWKPTPMAEGLLRAHTKQIRSLLDS